MILLISGKFKTVLTYLVKGLSKYNLINFSSPNGIIVRKMKKIGRQDEKRGVCVGIVCLLALTFMKVEGAAIAVAPVG